MNTYLINADKYIIKTQGSAVVEKSNKVDNIQFIAPKEMNGFDLNEFDFVLQYKLPISKAVHIESLKGTDYKDNYLLYTLPTTAKKITSEPGNVEMSISLLKVELDEEGNQVRYVMNCANSATLPIVPMTNWFNVPDDGISELADLYLANKAMAENLAGVAKILHENKADSIYLDTEKSSLYLTASGEKIGEGIPLDALNAELVEAGSKSSGNVKIVNI